MAGKRSVLAHPRVVRLLYKANQVLIATYGIRVVNDAPWIRHLEAGGRVVICIWHQQFFSMVQYFRKFIDYRPAMMISRSSDGEIGAGIAQLNGWTPIRGSSSKGGVPALMQMVKSLKAHPLAAHIVDGPKGPAGRVKPGVVQMARLAGAALVPVVATADNAWYLNSWDRYMIPKPFARVTLRFFNPIHLERRMTPWEMERVRLHLEGLMRKGIVS